MRNLYLVRHGKPQYPDEHSYCVGQTDFSLSMLGHLQAVLLNEELSDKISGVYCSPLLRTVETAGHMAPELPISLFLICQNEIWENGMAFLLMKYARDGRTFIKRVGITLIIRSREQKLLLHLVFAFRRQFIRFFALLKVILQW